MLRDEAGHAVAMQTFFSKPFYLVFAYHTCPQLCGVVLAGLTSALRQLAAPVGGAFDVVVVSFDPHDTPQRARAAKARYVARYRRGDGRGWHFLTGNEAAIQALTRAAGFDYFYDPIRQRYVHPAGVIGIGRGGVIRGYLQDSVFAPARLAALLDDDAGGGDPTASLLTRICGALAGNGGRYTTDVLAVVRIACGATLGIGALIALGVRMRRRRGRGRR
jgi:protein SCO1/2